MLSLQHRRIIMTENTETVEDEVVFVGSCNHPLTEEWYNDEESTYLCLDEHTGVVATITTCEDCKQKAEDEGRIMDEIDDSIIDDLLYNPFADDPAPDTMVVFDADGNKQVVEIKKE